MRAVPVCAPRHEPLRKAAVPPVPRMTALLLQGCLGTAQPESRPSPRAPPWVLGLLPASSPSVSSLCPLCQPGLAPTLQHCSSYCTY
uniref:Macaca fascicularis brain cDNA clone: QflA-20167, similar to human protein tyrosine phosphatase, non-receptor type 5(striatum-enriched) (PTPN5), mRNA, RefSeq: NM_032781.2 n=1 Tax=Macaca fascicularis TaxID=9541 RepID=I7GCR9_MACFA|nr:unnamed protein product [Macaca fascicularis]